MYFIVIILLPLRFFVTQLVETAVNIIFGVHVAHSHQSECNNFLTREIGPYKEHINAESAP